MRIAYINFVLTGHVTVAVELPRDSTDDDAIAAAQEQLWSVDGLSVSSAGNDYGPNASTRVMWEDASEA